MNAARRELFALRSLVGEACPPTPSLEKVSQRPRVGVGAILLCKGRRNKLLVGRRRGSHGAGYFALPGGHLENGATFATCASSEVLEECGIHLAPARFKFVHLSNDVFPEDLHYVTVFMAAEISEEEASRIKNEEEDKNEAWLWEDIGRLGSSARAGGGQELPLFIPLQNFFLEGGQAKVEEALQLSAHCGGGSAKSLQRYAPPLFSAGMLAGGAAALLSLWRADYRNSTRGALAFLVCSAVAQTLGSALPPV